MPRFINRDSFAASIRETAGNDLEDKTYSKEEVAELLNDIADMLYKFPSVELEQNIMRPIRKYCEKCGKEVETKIVTKQEEYEVHGELIKVNARVLVCANCGEEFYCEELDNATITSVCNEYRRRHGYLRK